MTTATKPCDLFPMLGAAEFEALKRDIAEHGQREAILCVDGEIVDGRNRMRACEELGIEPIVRNITADEAGDVFALVMSLNYHRRHLTPKERGIAAEKLVEHRGQKLTANMGRPSKESARSGHISVKSLADDLGVPRQTLQRDLQAAADFKASSPENQAKVDAGELTPKQARVATEKASATREPREGEDQEPARTKTKRRIEQVRADCESAIDVAIGAAITAYPELKAEIAAHQAAQGDRLVTRQGYLPVGPEDRHLATHQFRAERLTLARELRGLSKVELAHLIGKTASSISQFEIGRTRPDVQTVAALQLALQVPLSFFATQSSAPALATDGAFFRSLRSTSQKDRRRLLARGSLISAVVQELESLVQFPVVDVPFLDVDVESPDALEEAALELRRRWNLGLGPISNITNLLESKGVLVAQVSEECADVDAFSVRGNYRPLVFLVGSRPPSRCRFDAAHELAHLVVHADIVPANPDLEGQAHRVGAAFMVPKESFLSECPTFLNIEHFYELKRRWRMSVQALVRRAYDLDIFSEATYRRAFVRLGQLGERTAERLEPPAEPPTLLAQGLSLVADRSEFCARLGLSEAMLSGLG